MKQSGYYYAAQQALHQWGAWARRPQFWANLRGHGMFAAFPLPRSGGTERERYLDPFSRRMHQIILSMPDREAGILYAYYVRCIVYDDEPEKFRSHGIGRRWYYELLKRATEHAYGQARGRS